ncbi:hypothetical protein EC957_001243 [Mortierella hygrophila]|uniref:Uncharacterized protein n=1 Tax=Mortierella hygrophila TaxID=979708 RepID=A0A9P6K2H8_9FUNG|nr:hypothetical protein EC957_001243 [Mortierella hygrophila]
MVDNSTAEKMDGKVSIVYERLGDLQWLPGKGDRELLRRIKHWRLTIQLGFDAFTLKFLENSIVSHQGILIVGTYDQVESRNATAYLVGDLKGLSTEVLYKWIQEQSKIWKVYNMLTNNCQPFVHVFLADFETCLFTTGNLAAVYQKHEQPQSEQQEQEEQCHNQKECQCGRSVIPYPMQNQSLQYQNQHQHQHHQPQNCHSSHHNQNQQYRNYQQYQSQPYENGQHGTSASTTATATVSIPRSAPKPAVSEKSPVRTKRTFVRKGYESKVIFTAVVELDPFHGEGREVYWRYGCQVKSFILPPKRDDS